MQDTKTKFFKNIQDNKTQIDPAYGYSNLVIPDYQKSLDNMCENCQKLMSQIPSKAKDGDIHHSGHIMCPFRTIDNDYCEDFDTLQRAIHRLDFVEKNCDILDIALDNYIAKNLGLTKNELGIYGCDNYKKILNVRKELVKLAKEELENDKI